MNENFLTLDQVDVRGLRVLVRGDMNVPIHDGIVGDTSRLSRLAETVKELAGKKAKVIILSHFGRPENGAAPEYSLKGAAKALGDLMQTAIVFCDDLTGAKAKAAVAALQDGQILVLENTRFEKGETKNDQNLAQQLAGLGDIFVNDAFSVSHRAHASTEGITRYLPSYAGREMQAELEALTLALEKPQRPVMAIVGGAKVSTKLELLTHLCGKVDKLVLGGGMANTFLAAQGKPVGKSLFEKDMLDTARTIMAEALGKGCTIILPVDVVVAKEFKENPETTIVASDCIPADQMALDVGPQSVAAILAAMAACKTLVWNGPLGAFETPPFEKATRTIAHAIGQRTQDKQLVSVAGGGDTVAAINMAQIADKLTYMSMAGGAFLEWMEGRVLPGVEALRKNKSTTKACA